MQPEAIPAQNPAPAEWWGLPRPRPVPDLRLVAGFFLANGLVTLAIAAGDALRELPPTIGAAPIDLLLAAGLALGVRGAVPATRLRLVAMLAVATWNALEYGDVAGGLRAALFVVPAFVLLSRPAWPGLRAVLRIALVPVALLLSADAWVAAADLWFPVGELEFGNRYQGRPVAAVAGPSGDYRIALRPGRWRAYRPEYLARFVPSAEAGVVDPYSGVDLLIFRTDGALVAGDPRALEELIDASLHDAPVDLELDSLEVVRRPGFDVARVAAVHGAIGGAEVQGYVAFFVRDDVTLEGWAVGDPDAVGAIAPELRDAAGALELVAPEPAGGTSR